MASSVPSVTGPPVTATGVQVLFLAISLSYGVIGNQY